MDLSDSQKERTCRKGNFPSICFVTPHKGTGGGGGKKRGGEVLECCRQGREDVTWRVYAVLLARSARNGECTHAEILEELHWRCSVLILSRSIQRGECKVKDVLEFLEDEMEDNSYESDDSDRCWKRQKNSGC